MYVGEHLTGEEDGHSGGANDGGGGKCGVSVGEPVSVFSIVSGSSATGGFARRFEKKMTAEQATRRTNTSRKKVSTSNSWNIPTMRGSATNSQKY